ncbi:MAG: hypothetical protein V4642_00665 [Bacteroidota bacterium]
MAEEVLKKSCLKCGGEMEEGLLPDYIGAFGIMPVWVKGGPEKGTFSSLKLASRKKLRVFTWRCIKCGFLESYAHDWKPRR